MALTFNNFTGFETGGLEEASTTSGSPDATEATTVRSGIRALKLPGGSNNIYIFDIADGGVASAGNDHILGFAFQFSGTPTVKSDIMRATNAGGGNDPITMQLDTDRTLIVIDRDNVARITSTTALSVDTYYFIELYWQNLDSGNAELFINSVSEGTTSARDFKETTLVVDGYSIRSNLTASEPDHFFDDVYILTGASSASDRLSNFAVKTYQSTDVGATDQGDTLADGTWALVSETPGNEGTSNDAQYQDTGNLTGSTITDGGDRPGPSGDSDVTGATIKGAKYISNLMRGTGGGRTHTILHGNSGDGVTATADLGLTVDFLIYEVLSESASIVPTESEFMQMGFSKSATGGQDIFCGDQWAMLGYVPAAGNAPDTDAQLFIAGQQQPVIQLTEIVAY